MRAGASAHRRPVRRSRSRRPTGRRLLDPSGLVKGWAVERAAAGTGPAGGLRLARQRRGDVLARARYGPPWRVAVEDPGDRDEGALRPVAGRRRGRHLRAPPPAAATSSTRAPAGRLTTPCSAPPSSAPPSPGPTSWRRPPSSRALRRSSRIAAMDGYEALLVLPDGQLVGTPGASALLAAGLPTTPSVRAGQRRPGAPGAAQADRVPHAATASGSATRSAEDGRPKW